MYKITQEQLQQMVAHLNELPFKYASPLINLLNSLEKIEEKKKK